MHVFTLKNINIPTRSMAIALTPPWKRIGATSCQESVLPVKPCNRTAMGPEDGPGSPVSLI